MSNRNTTVVWVIPIVLMSLVVGMVLASRLDLAPRSSAQTVAVPPMNSAPLTGALTASTFRDIAKSASPSVVNIRTESRQRARELSDFFGGGGGGGGDDLFEQFFGRPNPNQNPNQRQNQRPRERVVQAAGTGFIIDKSGFILTNNHVVEGATKIAVSLYAEDGQEYDARIVGRDPLTDSALIELTEKPGRPLAEIKFGDSGQMQPGDWVMAIGNPFGFEHTVSVGVISGLERDFQVAPQRTARVLQTDAAINPGNSGGPLLNIRGEVIGMNTAIISDGARAGNIGIGFAVPSNTVRELLPQLRTGKVTRGRIGVQVTAVPRNSVDELGLKSAEGALVSVVAPDGAAAKAKMEPGDVIVSFNSKPVRNNNDLVTFVTATRPGTTVPVRIIRDGREQTLSLTVDELNLEAENQQARNGDNTPDTPSAEVSTGFGLTLNNVTPDVARRLRLEAPRGALITEVEDNSPAQRAGLSEGDVILRVGRTPVESAADAQRELGRVPSGGTALLRVFRGGQETFVPVTKE